MILKLTAKQLGMIVGRGHYNAEIEASGNETEKIKDFIEQRLLEGLTTGDKVEVKQLFKSYMDSSDVKSVIEIIVRERIQNEKGLENKVVEITKNVLIQLYKNL